MNREKIDSQALLRQQIALARFGELALRSNDLTEILTEACRLVGEALGTDLAKVVELLEDGHTLLVRAGVGWKPGVVGEVTIEASDRTSEGNALKTGEPMISPDIATEKRFTYPPFLIDNGVRAVANVVIIGGEGKPPFGILQVDSRQPREFTSEDSAFLRSYANVIAAAVARLRLNEGLLDRKARLRAALAESKAANELLEAQARELTETNGRLRTEAKERARVEHALRQSQKMEAVGQLTGGLAHDFNNLLQVISGNLQLLAKDVIGNEAAEQRLRNALGGVSRGSKLASQLLAFGRRQPLEPKVVGLDHFLRGVDDMLRRTIGEEIELETVVEGGIWNTFVDTAQLENAILNLAINARDAMMGQGKLTIEAENASLGAEYAASHAEVTPGQYVMIAVTDTGPGIPPNIMERVFEPFFTTKGEGKGTGLGLSMVYGFVKQSRGHAKIYSEAGKGTAVRIYLPRTRRAEDVAAPAVFRPIEGGKEMVLVVEDDEAVRDTVVGMLADLGYRVLKANDAQAASVVIESGVPIDVLFTDVVMPGPLRSTDLAKIAREKLPKIAILFTSGYTDKAIVHGGYLDEGTHLLSKPYTKEALARKLRHVVNNQEQKAITSSPHPNLNPVPSSLAVGKQLRVLFVEDEPLIRAVTADLLSELGHTVMEAKDAAAAMKILAAEEVDLLLTDVNLPGQSGIDLALQSRRRFPNIMVVLATGYGSIPDREGLPGAVMLTKPYEITDIAKALHSVADSETARRVDLADVKDSKAIKSALRHST